MKILRGTPWMATVLLAGASYLCAGAQQPAPVPITSDTPATTAKPMPPETTPVRGSAATSGTPMTKGEMKSQRKQQKSEEKAAASNAKAAKSSAKAKKQADKATRDQEKANAAANKPQ